ncbi:MAG: hypothetical protein IJ688_11985 [Treponema sp.]|nr:hypothetical protein [Treponema sp.]
MEKYLQKIKSIFFILVFLIFPADFFAQVPSVIQNIRIPLRAELDAYPAIVQEKDLDQAPEQELEQGAAKSQAKEDGQYDYPIRSLKETAPYIIGGMVYGWEFYYTPSDKQRNVEEILEVTEIVSAEYLKSGIEYSSPWIQDNYFNCWCSYRRNESQIQNYNLWASIQNPIIQGRGYGSVRDGFDGLKTAANDALKNAVRSYYRNLIKNKPKAITGKVLIRNLPQIGIDAGRYVINLDFFLECGKIVQYEVY